MSFHFFEATPGLSERDMKECCNKQRTTKKMQILVKSWSLPLFRKGMEEISRIVLPPGFIPACVFTC